MKLIFTSLSILLSCCLSAQPVIKWSEAHTKPAMKIEVDIMGNSGGGFFVINKQAAGPSKFSPTIIVEYFNTDLERLSVKELTIDAMEDYVGIYWINGELNLLTSIFNKDKGSHILNTRIVGRDGNTGENRMITSIPAEKLASRGSFRAAVSPDAKKLLIISQPDFVKGLNEKIGFHLFEGSTKLWSAEKELPYQWGRAVSNDPYVNNNGTAYLLKKTDMKGSDHNLSVFSFNGKVLNEFKINLEGKKQSSSTAAAISTEGEFAVGGYYTEDAKVRVGIGVALQGNFICKVDAEGTSARINKVNAFDKRKSIIAKQILFNNETIILVGEEYYVSDRAPQRDPSKPLTNDQMFERDYSYSGNDIFIDGFDSAGAPVFFTRIKKDNTSLNDNGTWVSYFAAVSEGKIQILFNDDKYKYDEKKRMIVAGSPKIVVSTIVDASTGSASATIPLAQTGPVGGKSGDMLLRPDVFLLNGNKSYIIRAENPKIYRMGIITF